MVPMPITKAKNPKYETNSAAEFKFIIINKKDTINDAIKISINLELRRLAIIKAANFFAASSNLLLTNNALLILAISPYLLHLTPLKADRNNRFKIKIANIIKKQIKPKFIR